MGGKQSQLSGNSAATNGKNAFVSTSEPGASNDSNGSSSGGGENCTPCFFCLPGIGAKAGPHAANGAGGIPFPPSSSKKDKDPDDPMGSPLPETPIFQRKRRQQVQQALRLSAEEEAAAAAAAAVAAGGALIPPRDNSRVQTLSIYGFKGLEAEPSSMKILDGLDNGYEDDEEELRRQHQDDDVAGIYEGPNCETLLHQKYSLEEAIGVGSTSTVHRCIHKSTGAEYACKIIDCQLIEERFQGMMTQFQTEIAALRQLHHPNIIQLYDVYLTGEKIYIVMELMQGGEIFDYVVQKGTLSEEEASQIVRKVTSALVYMHANNICHRDLKPENLLLKKKPAHPEDDIDVKIIDFGLSKAMLEDNQIARTFLGTRGYLAPEMLQRRDYTKAVDTWALGVIVFVLVCGCLPFDDDSATVPSDDLVRTKFVLRFPRWAKNLSESAKNLLGHLLDVNPRTRYTAEQALEHPWVRGQTAPKDNLLASPGRIKTSPAFAKNAGAAGKVYSSGGNRARAGRGRAGGGRGGAGNRKKHDATKNYQVYQTSPPPPRHQRKTSM